MRNSNEHTANIEQNVFCFLQKQAGPVNNFGRSGKTRPPRGSVSISPRRRENKRRICAVPMNINNLTCRGICRGKISQRINQNLLEERTQ
jgi:hypothetical protein